MFPSSSSGFIDIKTALVSVFHHPVKVKKSEFQSLRSILLSRTSVCCPTPSPNTLGYENTVGCSIDND